jgi:small subunit ribosomal protein S18
MSEETRGTERRSGERSDQKRDFKKPKFERGFRKQFRKKECRFCGDGSSPDYKNVNLLRNFITERAKIMPRRITGNCAKHQRKLTTAVKRARILALIPFTMN